jgi:hypothetical protein
VLPYRELIFKRIKRRIKLRKKLQEHPSVPKTATDPNEQYLVNIESHDLNDHRLSNERQDASF